MFKGTVSVIFKICKDGNVNLVNNVDFTVTFLGLKCSMMRRPMCFPAVDIFVEVT